jgi:hypothetical protein
MFWLKKASGNPYPRMPVGDKTLKLFFFIISPAR